MELTSPDEATQLLEMITASIAKKSFDKKTTEALKMAAEHIENYKSIDQALVQTLKDMLGTESLHDRDSYDNVVKSLEEGSILVYFKSAQLFKAYKKDDVDKLLSGQLRTIYKHLATSYEIVPNSSKQKIIILAELSLEQHLNRIKQYIIAFMNEHGDVKLTEEDIICFRNQDAETVEIVINNYYVENSTERDEIVKALLEYIGEKERNNQMTRKMGFQNTSAFKDASMVAAPSSKQQIMETNPQFIEFVDLLVSNIKKCIPIVRNGTNITVQIGSVNIGNNIHTGTGNIDGSVNTNNSSLTTIIVEDSFERRIADFVDMIKNDKPDWYIEDSWVRRAVLSEKYAEIYDETPRYLFTALKGRLFTEDKKGMNKSKKNGREYYVKLFPFSSIV